MNLWVQLEVFISAGRCCYMKNRIMQADISLFYSVYSDKTLKLERIDTINDPQYIFFHSKFLHTHTHTPIYIYIYLRSNTKVSLQLSNYIKKTTADTEGMRGCKLYVQENLHIFLCDIHRLILNGYQIVLGDFCREVLESRSYLHILCSHFLGFFF